MGDLVKAEEHPSNALLAVRTNHDLPEELPVLVGLAEVKRQQRSFDTACEYLEDSCELTERNGFCLYRADTLNIRAQIKRDEGLLDEAEKLRVESIISHGAMALLLPIIGDYKESALIFGSRLGKV